jgi:choline dehydrogenase
MMQKQILFGLSCAIGASANSYFGRHAEIINVHQLSNMTAYDFVVVGGGIAGLTVADRLTENPNGSHVSPKLRSFLTAD